MGWHIDCKMIMAKGSSISLETTIVWAHIVRTFRGAILLSEYENKLP